MVDTIKISDLPLETSPTSDDIVPMVDGTTSTTKKVSFDEFGKAVNYSNALSTDTANLLNVDGSNKLLLRASDELISTDASNTLSVGADGKLYGSATALTLNENELFVGDASNVPTSTSVADVRALLGKSTGYINDTIEYVSATQVTWQGVCRDSSDSRDFELGSATTATLSSPTADTTYNLFVAGNTLTDTPVVVWSSGSTPAGYTYYRRVLSILTDGVGNIIPFTSMLKAGGAIRIDYDNYIETTYTSAVTGGTYDTNTPDIPQTLETSIKVTRSTGTTIVAFNSKNVVECGIGTSNTVNLETFNTTLAQNTLTLDISSTSGAVGTINIRTNGFVDERV